MEPKKKPKNDNQVPLAFNKFEGQMKQNLLYKGSEGNYNFD